MVIKSNEYKSLFSGNIEVTMKTAKSVLKEYPESALAYANIGKGLKDAEKLRKQSEMNGLDVPPLMIIRYRELALLFPLTKL